MHESVGQSDVKTAISRFQSRFEVGRMDIQAFAIKLLINTYFNILIQIERAKGASIKEK